MADAKTIRTTIERYCATFTHDREDWLDLFAADATVEDPVGSEVHRGREAIGAFWDASHALADEIVLEPTPYVKVADGEGAFAMDARMRSGDQVSGMSIIDVMTFDHSGRITSMRAYWDLADVGPV
jgi:steroid Delta-isomerase